jgi:hypothetical protein
MRTSPLLVIYKWMVIVSAGAVVTFAVLFMKTLRRIPEPLFYGALFATSCFCFWFLSRHSRQQSQNPPHPTAEPASQSVPTLSLADRIFATCKRLSDYIVQCGNRPDEEKLWAEVGTSEKSQLFIARYNAEIQPWDDKLAAGYWLSFRDCLVNLRHELTLNDRQDQQLVMAMTELDLPPTKT